MSLTVHAYDWSVEDNYTDEGHTAIHAWCLDRESKPYLLRINDFPIFCHVELPLFVSQRYMRWSPEYANDVFIWMKRCLGDDAPLAYQFYHRKKLYYYRGDRVQFPMLQLQFKNLRSMQRCEAFLNTPRPINDWGYVAFQVLETSVSPVRKLLTLRNCRYSQWFQIHGVQVTEQGEKVSKLVNEYIVNWMTLTPIAQEQTKSWTTYPRILSFDIETYSHKHKAMPDRLNSKHVVNVVSCIYQQLGRPETREKYVLTLGSALEMKDVNIISCQSEKDLINALSDLVIRLDPEIVTGYNIFGYDYPYLDARLNRANLADVKWKNMGRLVDGKTAIRTKEWQSSAYGHNSMSYLKMDGRISIDVMPVVKRDYKLDKYDLGTVSMHFLGRTKHDVKPAQMFRCYEALKASEDKYNRVVEGNNMAREVMEELKKEEGTGISGSKAPEMLGLEGIDEKVQEVMLSFLKALKDMRDVLAYCVEDSNLVIDIFQKINIWIGMIELSNIVGVSPMDLFISGQQVRCVSLLYDLATKQGYVLDRREVPLASFNGGFVFEPIPGLYDNVICLDFASLYPSIMQAFNICYTTLVPPDLMTDIPDEKCHVFDFDQDEVQDSEEDDNGNVKESKTTEKKIHYHYKWVKQEVRQGLLPQLVRDLVSERREVRKVLDGVQNKETKEWIIKPEEDPVTKIVLNCRQLALKVTANSFFGFLGAQEKGRMPLIEGAMCITAKGRELIGIVNNHLRTKYSARIVYGDTDSVMADLNLSDPGECNRMGHHLSKEISALFPPPLTMEFEKAMRMFCLGKKMYSYLLIGEDGQFLRNKKNEIIVGKKGIATARRDKCKWMTNAYDKVMMNILFRQPITDTMDIIIDTVHRMITGQVPIKEVTFIRQLGAQYKSPSYFMKVFGDEVRKLGKFVSPGDRLEYLVVKVLEETLLGKRMRLLEAYKEDQEAGRIELIDDMYYIENALMNAVDLLFGIGYKEYLDRMPGAGYKPKTRHHFVPISHPVKMMIRMIHDKESVVMLKTWIREQLILIGTWSPVPEIVLNVTDPSQVIKLNVETLMIPEALPLTFE